MSLPGAPAIKLLVGSLLQFPTGRLPGRGARPPPPAPSQGFPAAPPRWTSAIYRGSRTARVPVRLPRALGVLAAPLPGSLGCSRPGPLGWAPGPPPGTLGKPASAAEPSQPGRRCRKPLHPQVRRRPAQPCTGPAVPGPSSPRPGARPWPGGPALRTREGTRPPACGALTHRPRYSSPRAPPPPALLSGRHPDQVSTSEDPGPGTPGSSARRARREPARRARSAGPRERAGARGEGGATRAARLQEAVETGHARCLSLLGSFCGVGGDPEPVKRRKVHEGHE